MAGDESKSSHKNIPQQGRSAVSSAVSSNDNKAAILKELPLELQRWVDELGGDYKAHLTKKALPSNTIRDSI